MNRHFWLQTKIQPSELDTPTNENQFYKIVPVTPIATTETKTVCSDPETYLKALGCTYDIDGLLFYHRQAHYNGGATPLVGWVPRDDVASIQSIF
jgi:snurportin-1